MEGGVVLAYSAPAPVLGYGVNDMKLDLNNRPPALPLQHSMDSDYFRKGCGSINSNGQSSHILRSILSMQVERHELVSQSPPGHGYILPPTLVQNESMFCRSVHYPTPPSSNSSSPEPQEIPHPFSPGLHSQSPSSPSSSLGSPKSLEPPPSEDFTDSNSVRSMPSYSVDESSSQHTRSEFGSCKVADSNTYSSPQPSSHEEEDDQPINLKTQQFTHELQNRLHSPESMNRPQSVDSEVRAESEGDEPMDLSCPKRSKPCHSSESSSDAPNQRHFCKSRSERKTCCAPYGNRRNSKLVYQPDSVPPLSQSILKSILCGQLRSRDTAQESKEDGDDNRTSSPFIYSLSHSQGLIRSPNQRVADLIRKARLHQQQMQARSTPLTEKAPHLTKCSKSSVPSHKLKPMPPLIKAIPDPQPAIFTTTQDLPPNTEVSLAKKNLLPISARVSDWLLKLVQFAKSLPEFASLSKNDQVTHVLSSWSRLILLDMAETNFEFAVNPSTPKSNMSPTADDRGHSASSACSSSTLPSTKRPTLDAVEGITRFLKKCQALDISSVEMNYLRLLTLFNPSYQSTENPAYIENVNSHIRKCLHDACASLPDRGKLRYSQLLLVLPPLFGIRPEVMESLFCQHITINTDMELLLKEMLHKL